MLIHAVLLLSLPAAADPGSGEATISPNPVAIAGSVGTWTIKYIAVEEFDPWGAISITIPDGWTPPQTTDSSLAGYVDIYVTGDGELYDPPWSISGQVIDVWIDTLAVDDEVYVVYGDTSKHPNGIATAQTVAQDNVEFTVESNPSGFGSSEEITSSPTLNVLAAEISQLVFTTPERTVTAGEVSDRMIVQAQDEFGNPSPVAANQDILLSSTSVSGEFSALGGGSFTPTTTVTIQAGEDTVSFYYRDELAGIHDLTASPDGPAWTPDTQQVTIEAEAPYQLTVTPQDTTAEAGDFVTFTLHVEDQYGNPSPVASAQTCTLYTFGQGSFYDAGDHGTPVTELVIAASTYSAQIDYMHTAMGNHFLAFQDEDGISPNLLLEVTTIDIEPSDPDAIASSVEGDETTVTANGADELEVTVTVRDEFDNPIQGVAVAIAATDTEGGNSYTQPGATGAGGIAIGYLSSTVAEPKIVRAYIDGTTQIVDTLEVDFVADQPSLSVSEISVDPPTVTADDEDTLTVTVTVLDDHGNPVSGSYVTIEATGTGNRYVPPGTTGANGVAVGYMFSTVAESKTVSFRIGGNLAANTASADFIAGPADLVASEIEADPLSVVADGADTLTVTVTVRDEFGNPVAGSSVTLSASGSGNTIDDPTAPSDSNGEAVGYIFSTVAESKTIGFSIGGTPAPATVPVDFVAGEADPSISDISADPLSLTADGSQATTVTVTALDANGNTVSGSVVEITASGTDNTITQPSSPTDENGEAVGYIRSTKAETKTIGFIIDSAPADSTVEVVFLPGDVNYTFSSIAGDRDTVFANGSDTLTVTVTAIDDNSNPVPGQNVTLEVDPSRPPAQNEIIQPGPTRADGIAIGYVLSTVAEEKNVSALIEGVSVTGQVTVLFRSDEVDPDQSEVAGYPSVVSADGIDSLTVTVTARDEFGNPVSGSFVELEVDPARAENTIINPPGTTDDSGVAVGYVKSTYAEQKTVTVLINGVPATQTVAVEFVSGEVSASQSGIGADPLSVTADGTDTVFVTVTARDENGNPVAGRNVSLTVDPPRLEPENVIIDPSSPTDANGEAVGRVLSTVAEPKTIGAVIGGITIDSTVAVDFEPGTYSLSESGISVAPSEVTADGDDTLYVTVTVRDAFGNPVPDREVTLSSSGTGNTIEDPISWTDANGRTVGYIFSTVAESKTIGFSIEGDAADSTTTALFVAGAVDLANSLIEVSPPSVTANGIEELDVTITARDSRGNPVEGESVTIEVDPVRPENTITQPPVPTNATGQAFGSVRSTYAEIKTIRAYIGGLLMPSPETAQFVAGDVDYFIITHDGTAMAGAPEEVTIDVRDENDNRLDSFTGTITVYTSTSETEDRISWDALPALGTIVSQSGDSADYQFALGDGGIATLRITDLTAESITISATDGSVTSASGSPLVVGHAAADSIFSIIGDGQTAVVQQPVAVPLTVGVEDRYGNRVQGETVTFTILDGLNAEIDTDLSLPGIQLTAATDINGTTECEYWKLGEISGVDSDRVEASIASGATTSAIFTATALHGDIASIDLEPDDRSATVGQQMDPSVTATARDQFGNIVVGEKVKIFLKDPIYGSLSEDPTHPTDDGTSTWREGFTDASGMIYVIYNAPATAGLQDVLDASHADLPASSVDDVVYTSVANGATRLRVTVLDGETSHAGETFTFLVEAVDDNGNLFTDDTSHIILDPDIGGGFTFSLTDFGATVTTADLVNGSVTLYGRGSYAGTWNVDVDESTNSLDSDGFSIAITAEDVVDHYVITTPPSATAGFDFTVRAEAQDRFNNLVTTANYAITIHAVDAADTGQPASAELNKTTGNIVNGVYTETAMRYTVAEDIRIEITGGVAVTAYSDPISVGHAAAFQIVNVSGDVSGVPAGSQVTLTARVDDIHGNPVNGEDVTFTRQTGGGSPVSAVRTSDITGEASLLYTTGTTAGDNIVRAAILDGDPDYRETQSFTVTTVPQAGIDYVTITLTGTSFAAGEPFAVDIEAFDAYDNKLVNDFSTHLIPIALNPSMTFIPDEVTLSAGEASFDATDTQAGTNRIAITSLGGDTLSEWSPEITISPADAFSIIEVSGDSTGVIAGTSVQLKARVRDEYGNNVGDEIVQFSITSNLGGAPELTDGDLDPSNGRVRTDVDGIAICSLTTDVNAGDNTVDATILDGNPPEQRKTFTVSTIAGTISRYDVIPDGTTKMAGESFSVTITAYDLNDNIATDDNTTQVDLSSDGSAVFSVDPVTLTAGTAAVTVSDEVAEQLIISAETLGGGALSHSEEITILPEVPTGLIAIESISPDTLTANAVSKSTITTAPITDQYGNIVSAGTMITVSAALGDVASEDRDDTTPGVQRMTGVNGKVSVFIQSDSAPGTDTITFQSVEGSALGTAALVYAPPPDCRYADYMSPRVVVPGELASFRYLVENQNETGLYLNTSSTFSFSDALGNTYSAVLEDAVFIGASGTDTLEFGPETVPAGMLGDTYTPEVNLRGTDIYGSAYSTRIDSPINSIIVSSIEILSITNPLQVSRGDTVDVGVRVKNNGDNDVIVQEIDLYFEHSNSTLVGGNEWIPALDDTLYGLTDEIYWGRVAVSVDYVGIEDIDASVIAKTNGTEVRDPSADDAIGVWQIQNAADISYIEGSLSPMTVSQGQEQSFSLSLRNDGEAGVFLDPLATFMIFQDGLDAFIVYPSQALALPGNATTDITFPAEVVPSGMDPGLQQVDVVLIGTENGGYYYRSLTLSDSVMVTTPALVSYEPGTLDPSIVSKGSSVSFGIGVQNTGSASVECAADSTWMTFGGGAYRALLDRNRGTAIAPETLTMLYFVAEEIPEALATGLYTADVRIFGTENGLPFETMITPGDDITLEDPPLLAINSITVPAPATITADQGSPWSAEMIVENTGVASVRLDSLELRLFNGALDVLGEVQITSDFVAGTELDEGNSASIAFEFSDDPGNPMTVGTVVIDATVWGTDLNSQEELTANTEKGGKGSYTVQTPALITVLDVLPSVEHASAGQTRDWVIDVAIRNNGQSNADISLDADSTLVAFSTSEDFLVTRPLELAGGGTVLEGLATDTLRFVVDQTGSVSGGCTIEAFVGGTETNCLRLLPLGSSSTQVDIQSEALLVIDRLTPLQNPVTLSQAREWSIEMEVTNSGQSDVTIDPLRTDSMLVEIPAGAGFGFDIDNPAGFVSGGTSLGGGETKHLHFTVSTTGNEPPGSQEISGSIYAIEDNSGRPVYTERSGIDYVTLQRRPDPGYVPGSLAPTVVSSGTSVSIGLGLESGDPDHSTIHLDPANTTVSFSDGEGDSYEASLSSQSVDSLSGGATSDLLFESAEVDPDIARQSYSVAIHLEGTENGNFFEADLETAPDDSLRVQVASQLSINGIVLSQQSITAGQTAEWQARMVVQNNGEAAVDLDLDPAKTRIALIIGGSTVTGEYDITYPTELAISGSDILSSGVDTLVFTITQTGTTAGLMQVHGYIEGIDINSEELLTDNTFEGGWATMDVQLPGEPRITVTTPDRETVTSGQTTPWTFTVTVCNDGEAALTLYSDSTLIHQLDPMYTIEYDWPGEFEGGGTSLSGGECRDIIFTVSPTIDRPNGEDLLLYPRVGFFEDNSGEYREYDTGLTGENFGEIRVQAPADLSIARVDNAAPRTPYVDIGQRFPIVLEVVNDGEAAAGQISVSLVPGGASSIEDTPVIMPLLEGSGAAIIDTFHVTASDIAGIEIFTAAIDSAMDINSGQNGLVEISPSPDDTVLAEIQIPGSLVVTWLEPSQDEVNQGQIGDWDLTAHIENTGESAVLLDIPAATDIVFRIDGIPQTDYIVEPPTGFASGAPGFVLSGYASDALIYTVSTTGSDTGTVDIRASLDWENMNIPDISQAAAFADTFVHVVRPSGLRIRTVTTDAPNNTLYPNTAIVNTGQTFNLTVHVENTGGDHIDSLVVDVDSNNGTEAIYTGDPYPSILSGEELDLDFSVTASDVDQEEILTASIVYAVSRNEPEKQVDPLQADDNTENIRVQLPALLSVDAWISEPAGATDGTVSVGQEFVLTSRVVNEGTASVDASGQMTLTLPTNMALVDPGSEPLVRSFMPGTDISWRISAPADPSQGDDLLVEITNAPVDVNIDPLPAAISDGDDTVTVVTVDAASIDIADLYFESPAGAADGILSTGQDFAVAARFTASVNCDSVRLELVLPAGFTVGNGLVQYVGAGTGVEDTLRWDVTAPASEVLSETIRVIPRGKDRYSGASFTDQDETTPIEVVPKAELELTYYISGPPEATDRILSVGLVFTVTADVENLGIAGVDTAGARLLIELPPGSGYSLSGTGETYTKTFWPSEPVTWSLQAPSSPQPTPADITVTFAEPYATDENTGESADLIEDQNPISVVTEEGQLEMTNLSDIDTIPPYVVPQGALNVPVLRAGLHNGSTYTVGLDTLYLTVERGGGQVVEDPSRYVTSIDLVTGQGVFSAAVQNENPVPIIVDHDYLIGDAVVDTFLIEVDIAGGAPSGELRFDIAVSDDIVFTIVDGSRISAVWAGDGGDIEDHFLSGPLSVMSKDFEEYVHNYPNPFQAGSESTKIAYFMTADAPVSIKIYDLMGNLVFTKHIPSGEPGASGTADGTWCETEWDGRNNRGEVVRNGVYLCKLEAGSRSATFKIAVAK